MRSYFFLACVVTQSNINHLQNCTDLCLALVFLECTMYACPDYGVCIVQTDRTARMYSHKTTTMVTTKRCGTVVKLAEAVFYSFIRVKLQAHTMIQKKSGKSFGITYIQPKKKHKPDAKHK